MLLSVLVFLSILGLKPTDEMLEQIMKEVAQETRESARKAAEVHFELMRRNINADKAHWSDA